MQFDERDGEARLIYVDKLLHWTYERTSDTFVFLIDNWDSPLNNTDLTEKDIRHYLSFFNILLCGQSYVALAYMTGLFPLRQIWLSSYFSNFRQYTMLNSLNLKPFIGFTQENMQKLCLQNNLDPKMISLYYGGYYYEHNGQTLHLYNTDLVLRAVARGQFESCLCCNKICAYLAQLIEGNSYGIKEDLVKLFDGECVECNLGLFQDITELDTEDAILVCLVHLGFLTLKEPRHFGHYLLCIPNKESESTLKEMLDGSKT